jgi:LCP family protein required for cell wall assembly
MTETSAGPYVFPGEADRPARTTGRAENWLLVGSDRRAAQGSTGGDAGEPLWRYGAQRADTIMLVHLPADRGRVYLVSFPRDAWVPIQGYRNAKLNAAFSFGGPPLLIATIERLTGVRVDHFAILDFDGFRSMTDALGGVNVRVVRMVRDPARKVVWPAGIHRLDGARALDFVRQRRNLPGGDLGRIKRQQAFLKALAGQVVDRGTLVNPLKLNAFLEAATRAVNVDESLTISQGLGIVRACLVGDGRVSGPSCM